MPNRLNEIRERKKEIPMQKSASVKVKRSMFLLYSLHAMCNCFGWIGPFMNLANKLAREGQREIFDCQFITL